MHSNGQWHTWQGLGASPGMATGKAHILRTERDFAAVAEPTILVARHATPALVPCLIRARAAVCETGGRLCHLAVVARELGKPCVTGLSGIVEGLASGVQLRVDGTRGMVEQLSPGHEVPVLPPPLMPPPENLVPVLQFGLFSAAFEHREMLFDLEMATRTAALVSLPMVFAIGSAWDFAITGNQVLVDAAALQHTERMLVRNLEQGTLKASKMRQKYRDLCTWHGWAALAQQRLVAHHLRVALCHYVTLNQITWAASIAKEQVSNRYRDFLSNHLTHIDAVRGQLLFLDSLIMPDHSYILRSYLEGQNSSDVWAQARPYQHQLPEQRNEALTTVQTLASNARLHQRAIIRELHNQLNEHDFHRAVSYIATLADLVDLTERKNTDLYHCGKALFGSTRNREAIGQLWDITALEGTDSQRSIPGHRRLVEILLARLHAWGALTPGLGGVPR
ncbi:MAG TPA: PEP-utilizing enzyme [Candidatus Tectomicrobia bacterium]